MNFDFHLNLIHNIWTRQNSNHKQKLFWVLERILRSYFRDTTEAIFTRLTRNISHTSYNVVLSSYGELLRSRTWLVCLYHVATVQPAINITTAVHPDDGGASRRRRCILTTAVLHVGGVKRREKGGYGRWCNSCESAEKARGS